MICKRLYISVMITRVAEGGFGPPQQGRIGKGNKAEGVVRKMAAGRKCSQHDKSPPDYVLYYQDKKICNECRAPVICTSFIPLPSALMITK
jgi:hypothetical protein